MFIHRVSRLDPEGSSTKWADSEDGGDWVPKVLEQWRDSPRPSISRNEAKFSASQLPNAKLEHMPTSRAAPISLSFVHGVISKEDRAQALNHWNALPEKLAREEVEQRRNSC